MSNQTSLNMERSEIADWFAGRSVFITGASGFIGKVLVEKLLSACPDIEHLYLLMRHKKDVAPDRRLDAIKKLPLFGRIRKDNPTRLDKMVTVSGDITLPDLGISLADKEMLARKVSVVFHTAATVKFDDHLKISVTMNILATQRLIELCKRWPKMESFVHVSTAYTNCHLDVKVEEQVYPAPGDIKKLVAACEYLDDAIINDVTPRMLGKHPNTYTYTKAMAENVVKENLGPFPMAIVRPSIVTAALHEPMPGWVDSLNGPTGLLVAVGKGLARTLYCKTELTTDFIPVDIVINCMVAAAWQIGVDATTEGRQPNVKVYNCTTSLQNPFKWGTYEHMSLQYLREHPLDNAFWYPGGSLKGHKFLHSLATFAFQTLPAFLIDYSSWLLGVKSQVSLVRVQKKIQAGTSALEFFTTHGWIFANDNVQALNKRLTGADRQLFDCDVRKINWSSYMLDYVKGIRKYVLKEEDSNIPTARSHMKKMKFLHYVVQLTLLFLFLQTVFLRSHSVSTIFRKCLGSLANIPDVVYGYLNMTRAAILATGNVTING